MSKRDLRLFLDDMEESCEAILNYVDGMGFDTFVKDRKTYSAVIREFEIIGEAAKHLPENFFGDRGVNLRDMVDFRNLLIHEYFGIDYEIVWNTIREDLLPLYRAILEIKGEY